MAGFLLARRGLGEGFGLVLSLDCGGQRDRRRAAVRVFRADRGADRRDVPMGDPGRKRFGFPGHRLLLHAERAGRASAGRHYRATVRNDRRLRRLHDNFVVQPADTEPGAGWRLAARVGEHRRLGRAVSCRGMARAYRRRRYQPLRGASMQIPKQATLLRIFVGEDGRHGHQPLYQAIVLKAREMHLAGATVLRGPLGYGHSSRLHTTKILRLSEDLPVVVEIIDSEERINGFLPVLDGMMTSGLVTLERVEVLQYGTERAGADERA